MPRHPQDCLVVVQISSRRVAATVAWRQTAGEEVVCHRAIECSWFDLDARGRKQALGDILRLASESAGVQIFSVYISLADASLRANFATGYADLGEEMLLTAAERDMSLVRATHQAIGTDREVLHALPQRWEVRTAEGDREVDDPIGSRGTRLTCHVLLVTVDRAAHADIEQILTACGVNVEGLIAQPVALYRGMQAHLRVRGSSVIIDLGARFTSLLVHRKGRLVHVETHAFGGEDLTLTLIQELQVSRERAEELKRIVDIGAQARQSDIEGQTYLWREVQERSRQLSPAARICHRELSNFLSARARDLRELELLAQSGRIHLVGRAAGISGLPSVVKEICKLEVVLGTGRPEREPSSEMADLMTTGLIRQAAIERERRLIERNASGIRQVHRAATGVLSWLLQPLR